MMLDEVPLPMCHGDMFVLPQYRADSRGHRLGVSRLFMDWVLVFIVNLMGFRVT